MALLFSHRQIGEYEKFIRYPGGYRVHKALRRLGENLSLLGINQAGFESLKKITNWYSRLSHPSALALASVDNFEVRGLEVMGSGFDREKMEAYRKEVQLRISACHRLYEVIEGIERHLNAA